MSGIRKKKKTKTDIQSDSIQFDSIQFDSIRFDSIQFDSIRFDSIRIDSMQAKDEYSSSAKTAFHGFDDYHDSKHHGKAREDISMEYALYAFGNSAGSPRGKNV